MNKIKILSPLEAAKIAAGEVVERPANILKELLENAIDAGASQITVYAEQAGKKTLRIVDNGCGMSHDDVLLSTVPHATSKISSVDDLVSVATYGFRGEALASIAAVSRLTITSRDDASEHAWRVLFGHDGSVTSTPVPGEQGTDIEVHDLFYNIPARKKFLKQDETEWNQLQQLVFAIALSHLEISFKVYHNDRLVLQAPAVTTLKDRVAQIWGVPTAQQFLDVQQESHLPIQLRGMVTSHQAWRHGKHQIFFFVNSRWVKDVELVKALYKGYSNVLPPGKFPAAVIMIDIDQAIVDVNVHPKKEEVRFTKPLVVSQAVMQAVQATLRTHAIKTVKTGDGQSITGFQQENYFDEKLFPAVEQKESGDEVTRITVDHLPSASEWLNKKTQQPVFKELGNVFQDNHSYVAHRQTQGEQSERYPDLTRSDPAKSLRAGNESQEEELQYGQSSFFEKPVAVTPLFRGRLVGQVLNTYLVIEQEKGIVFVDQHAAHERILYEQMKDQMVARQSSLLIFPQMVIMPDQELLALERFDGLFADFGISCDRVGPQALAIKAVPLGVAQIDLEQLLKQAAALVIEHDHVDAETIQKILYEHVHSHLACKRAVKAGDILADQQMEKLLQDLATVEKPFICIHGRPTYWQLGQHELEKFFRR